MSRNSGGRMPGPAGEVVQSSCAGKPKRIATSGKRWSAAAEAIFLDTLAASCNVTRSAAAAGFSTVAIYNRRRKWPAFAADWEAALAQGFAQIDALLVENARDTLAGTRPRGNAPIPDMTVSEAMKLLQLHRAAVHGGGRAPHWRATPASPDAARASILRKVAAIRRAREAKEPPLRWPIA